MGNGSVSALGVNQLETVGESVKAGESKVEHGGGGEQETGGGSSQGQETDLPSQDSSAVIGRIAPAESPAAESVMPLSQQQSQGRRAPKK